MTPVSVAAALDTLSDGGLVIVADDCGGDLVGAADRASTTTMASIVRRTSGFVQVAMTDRRAAALDLPPMVAGQSTADRFAVAVDAADGITTGISAHDRAHTARLLGAHDSRPGDLRRPGHIVPVRVAPGGSLTSPSRAAAALDLVLSNDLGSAAYLADIASEREPLRQAATDELTELAERHSWPLVTVEDVVRYLTNRARRDSPAQLALLPRPDERATLLRAGAGRLVHFALRASGNERSSSVPLTIVRRCTLDMLFGSAYCDCRSRRLAALDEVYRQCGVLVYLDSPRSAVTQVRGTGPSTLAGCPGPFGTCDPDDDELAVIDSLRSSLGISRFEGLVSTVGAGLTADLVARTAG